MQDALLASEQRQQAALLKQSESHMEAIKQQQEFFGKMVTMLQPQQTPAVSPPVGGPPAKTLVEGLKKQHKVFDNTEGSFHAWSRKTAGYIAAVYKQADDILTAVSQQVKPIEISKIKSECENTPDKSYRGA